MRIEKTLAGLFIIAALSSCELEPFKDETNPVSPERTNVQEESSLFEPDERNTSFKFETNDTKYLATNGWTLWTVSNVNAAESFLPLSVEAVKESGKAEAGFGVVFCTQEIKGKSFMLTVLINAKGYYTIGKVSEGKFSYINGGWTECKNLYTGLGVKNTISVSYELNNNEFVLKLNGEEVEKFTSPENITFKYSYSGYVVVISDKENFPTDSVKVTFTNKYKK